MLLLFHCLAFSLVSKVQFVAHSSFTKTWHENVEMHVFPFYWARFHFSLVTLSTNYLSKYFFKTQLFTYYSPLILITRSYFFWHSGILKGGRSSSCYIMHLMVIHAFPLFHLLDWGALMNLNILTSWLTSHV